MKENRERSSEWKKLENIERESSERNYNKKVVRESIRESNKIK